MFLRPAATLLRLLANTVLVVFSALLGFVAVELATRLYLAHKGYYAITRFYVAPQPYGEYDRELGVRHRPNTGYVKTIVVDGRIAACLGEVSHTNQDGFRSRTTLAEYRGAEVKLVVLGDSFSHWKQNGATWPDLFQERVRARLDRQVAVLNLAAGGYGILQMIDAAARAADEHRPYAVIIAFITDDLTRGRWWVRNELIDGDLRPLLSPDSDNFSLAIAADLVVVDPVASEDWCARYVGSDHAPGLARIVERYRRVMDSLWKARGRSPHSFWDTSESVVLRTLLGGLARQAVTRQLPRIRLRSFQEDARFVEGVERLKRLGVHVFLFHLPTASELKAGRPILSETQQSLWRSLEESFGEAVVQIAGNVEPGRVPSRVDLEPVEAHPSYDGLEFYAQQVADRWIPLFVKRR